MCDGYNSLWSEAEFRVQNKDGHDNHKSNKCGSEDVDDHRLGKDFCRVAIFEFVSSQQFWVQGFIKVWTFQ